MTTSSPLVVADNLTRFYTVKSGAFSKPSVVRALAGASFTLEAGKTLAVVGESGCGKSTLARVVTMIESPTSGTLTIDGKTITPDDSSARAALRSSVQIVFQDPYGSLNPRQKIGRILEEPLVINRPSMSAEEREAKARDMLRLVGLRPEHYSRFPHMFSGGQRQRIAIARALMLEPRVLVLDEPVSALDLSIQSQILNLLVDLQDQFNLAYLFISHDLSVVKHMADDVMVMYLGQPVETGSRDAVFERAWHPYTRVLLSATPVADPTHQKDRIVLTGELPSPIDPPSGCAFHPRCWKADSRCQQTAPLLQSAELLAQPISQPSAPPEAGVLNHYLACHHPEK